MHVYFLEIPQTCNLSKDTFCDLWWRCPHVAATCTRNSGLWNRDVVHQQLATQDKEGSPLTCQSFYLSFQKALAVRFSQSSLGMTRTWWVERGAVCHFIGFFYLCVMANFPWLLRFIWKTLLSIQSASWLKRWGLCPEPGSLVGCSWKLSTCFTFSTRR